MKTASLFDLSGRVAAIVGAGSGIGEAVAVGCAAHGAQVVCLDLDEERARSVAGRIARAGGAAEAGCVDVRDAASVGAAFDGIRNAHGRLDIVVATPGVNVRKPILAYADEEFDRVVTVNLKGSFHVLQAAGRIMVPARQGSIILFASIRARVVEPGQSAYAATKAGIVQLVRTAAAEFGPAGVRVNAVAPGIVRTPLTEPIARHPEWARAYAAKTVFDRWATPDEMVGPVVFLASDAASYVTGTVLYVDGGWTAIDGRYRPPL
jgi:NAD(P)-dependent dehydrogenase (short-subunit alcohol dehydrogenase family)